MKPHCHLSNLKGISDEDYAHAQKVWQVFGIKNHDITTYMLNAIHYCLQICLKTLEIRDLKYINLILHILYPHQD